MMPVQCPLSLALSPSDGARGYAAAACQRVSIVASGVRNIFFSLSPSDGERARERGPEHF